MGVRTSGSPHPSRFRLDNSKWTYNLPRELVVPNSTAIEDYLKAIFHLSRDGGRVNTTNLARQLGVSKPSVRSMLKRLAAKGLVDYAPGHGGALTEEGRLATMREIVDGVVFLLENSAVNGVDLIVDGGWHCR